MAIPARGNAKFIVQDDRGFRANVVIDNFTPDISASTVTLATYTSNIEAVGTAVAALTNAKVVSTGFSWEFDIAQEPSTETGTYQLVIQKARLDFGDGRTLREFVSIPAPIDGLFLTSGQDNLIVVDPGSTDLANLQSATAFMRSPMGGTVFSQFFGGQLREGKPRRRRVLQGA